MTLALIAGTGDLPPHLVRVLADRGEVPVICEMEGLAAEVDPALPRLPFRLETLGTFLATLAEIGVTQVCMAGAMRRPAIDPDAIDARTAPLWDRLVEGLGKGDDGTLRTFVALFEEQGIEVRGASEIAPDLLPPAGVLTRGGPGDIGPERRAARAALAEMGAADMGQALVAWGARVIAREGPEGTDAMLASLGAEAGRGAVLFKAPKPGQERRVDLPVIGPETARRAAEAELAGIVLQAGGVMVLRRAEVVADLDRAGLFLEIAEGVTP